MGMSSQPMRNSARIEDMVRARLQSRLASAGVRERDVALEVLYWLPAEFMEAYIELFLKALSLKDGSSLGRQAGDEGQVMQKTGAKAVGRQGRRPVGRQSGKGGGGTYRGEWVVKDEQALEVKNRVDRRLRGIVQGVMKRVKEEQEGQTHGSTPDSETGSRMTGFEMRRMGGQVRKVCRQCGKLLRDEFVRCPYSHE